MTDNSQGCFRPSIAFSGIIKASPGSVINLFLDNSRVSEFNEHIIQVRISPITIFINIFCMLIQTCCNSLCILDKVLVLLRC